MTTATMRAKMRITGIVQHGDANQTLTMNAVGKLGSYPADGTDEDNSFATWTPSAALNIQITNPALVGKFEINQTFYVDFTPVDAPAPAAE